MECGLLNLILGTPSHVSPFFLQCVFTHKFLPAKLGVENYHLSALPESQWCVQYSMHHKHGSPGLWRTVWWGQVHSRPARRPWLSPQAPGNRTWPSASTGRRKRRSRLGVASVAPSGLRPPCLPLLLRGPARPPAARRPTFRSVTWRRPGLPSPSLSETVKQGGRLWSHLHPRGGLPTQLSPQPPTRTWPDPDPYLARPARLRHNGSKIRKRTSGKLRFCTRSSGAARCQRRSLCVLKAQPLLQSTSALYPRGPTAGVGGARTAEEGGARASGRARARTPHPEPSSRPLPARSPVARGPGFGLPPHPLP